MVDGMDWRMSFVVIAAVSRVMVCAVEETLLAQERREEVYFSA